MYEFEAELDIIGINPFVFVPKEILIRLFEQAGRNKGPIPICGTLNGEAFQQTLVKFKGEWRLYVNMQMLSNSPKRIGECLSLAITYDPSDRRIEPHPKLLAALKADQVAMDIFNSLPQSMQKEIIRYISRLRKEENIESNIKRAINFLHGKERFIGRDSPWS